MLHDIKYVSHFRNGTKVTLGLTKKGRLNIEVENNKGKMVKAYLPGASVWLWDSLIDLLSSGVNLGTLDKKYGAKRRQHEAQGAKEGRECYLKTS